MSLLDTKQFKKDVTLATWSSRSRPISIRGMLSRSASAMISRVSLKLKFQPIPIIQSSGRPLPTSGTAGYCDRDDPGI